MEIRKLENGSYILQGYVNAILRESRELNSPIGKFKEVVEPNVFRNAIHKADDIKILFNHNENRELGSISKGNLELFEDSIGLFCRATITDEEVIDLAEKRELTGWSFGFKANKDNWIKTEDKQLRYLEDIDLIEVSILSVTPAYEATSVVYEERSNNVYERRFIPNMEELPDEKTDDIVPIGTKEEVEEVVETEDGKTVERPNEEDRQEEIEKLKLYCEMINEALKLL